MATKKASGGRPAAPNKIDLIHVQPVDLSLDLENPRLAQSGEGRLTELDVIHFLAAHGDLAELVQSIASNGYLDWEPLIVVEEKGKLTVVEGNRRVAAIKVLKSPEKFRDIGFAVPDVAPDLATSLDRAGVWKIANRADARKYIGFKHINGPHKWDSFAKAKFAADWFRAEQKDGEGITLREIARRLGDRHDTVLRLVQGMFVLEQAKAEALFDMEDRFDKRPFSFSHLYTALTRPQYREYIGLDPQWRTVDPTPNPVPAKKRKNLKKVLQWMYGSDQDRIAPVVTSQNPHIKQLGEVLANPIALQRLETTKKLSEAYKEVDTREQRFAESLVKAYEMVEQAQQNVDAYAADEALLQVAERLSKMTRTLHLYMQQVVGAEEHPA